MVTRKAASSRSKAHKSSKPTKKAAPARPKRVTARTRAVKATPGKGKPLKAKKSMTPPATKAASKKVPSKPRLVVAKRGPDPDVRPLGVLPPESRVRASDRSAPAVTAHRAKQTTARPAGEAARGQGAQRVTEKDMKEFENRLLVERQKIMKEMGHLENTVLKVNQRDSAGDLSGYSFHMADAGTDAIEREKAFLFASTEGRLLMEVNEALRRLYRGEYGDCENCGQPIGRARLEAMPHARLCLACKEKEERANRGAL